MKKLFKCILAVALMFTCSINPIWAAGSQTANNTIVDVKDETGNEPTDYTVIFDASYDIEGSDLSLLDKEGFTLLTNDVLVAENANGTIADVENVTVTFEVPNLVAGTIEVYGNTGNGWELLDATINVEAKTITATFAKLPAAIAIMHTIDKTALVEAIEAAKAIDASKYTDASIAALASALTAAEVVNTNEDATQEQVDAAVAALKAAINALEAKEEPKVMDFYDVQDKSAWFYGSVEKAFQLGLMGATGKAPVEGKPFFEPDTNISRGMVATVLYRMAGMPTVTYTARFTDVANNLWYTNAIEWAAGATIVNGYGNTGKFGPDDNITRQDLAIMLRNYATKQAGLDGAATVDFSSFKDGSVVDAYAASAVAWCVENGIMSGSVKADGTYLMPKANATRAECAKMFSLLAEK